MKPVIAISFILLMTSCNTKNKVEAKRAGAASSIGILPKDDSIKKEPRLPIAGRKLSVKDSLNEEKVTNIFLALKEVKQLIHDTIIWSKTGRKFAWMVHAPDSVHNDYFFQVGYDSDERFEARYLIYINSKSLKVLFEDTLSDSLYSPEDFRKLKR